MRQALDSNTRPVAGHELGFSRALFGTAPVRTGLLLVGLLLLAACGGEYPQSTVDPVTDFGDTIHTLYVQIFWITMGILAVVWAILAYVLVRFRERPGQEKPRQIHGHLGMEVAWTLVPAVIVVAIAIPTIQAVFATQRPLEGDVLEVEVIGHRFWWEFRYPSGVVTANELHLPVDRPVSLRLSSADVIHSFWIPKIGGKRDVNPLVQRPEGETPRYTWLHFNIREPGTYLGQCAEFCGEAHSLMGMRVVAQSQEDFEAWERRMLTPAPTSLPPAQTAPDDTQAQAGGQEGDPPPAPGPIGPSAEEALVAQGRDIFHNQSFCVACHAIQGTNAQGVAGPNLTRVGARDMLGADIREMSQENLEQWIRDPWSMKPGAAMPGVNQAAGGWPATNLTDEQVRAVAAYLLSLN